MNTAWLEIIQRVKTGEISVEEGARLLDEMPPQQVDISPPLQDATWADEQGDYDNETVQPDLGWWANAWLLPYWIGTGVLVLSMLFMGWAYSTQHGFWFFCSWLPLMLGGFLMLFGWWSRQARWVHIRILDSEGKRVNISMPLPLRLAGWALRVFGRWIPQLHEQQLDDLPVILEELSYAEGPLSVEVDEPDGDQVRVYIL